MSDGPSDPSSNSVSGEVTGPVCQSGPPGQGGWPRNGSWLRGAALRFDALLAEQAAQPSDLIRQPVQLVGQGGRSRCALAHSFWREALSASNCRSASRSAAAVS